MITKRTKEVNFFTISQIKDILHYLEHDKFLLTKQFFVGRMKWI